MLKQYAGILNAEEIGKMLNKTVNAVHGFASTNKIPLNNHWSDEQEKELKELWGTVSVNTLAKRFNRTINAVEQKAYRMNLGKFFEANGEYLKISDVSRELNVDEKRVRSKWPEMGLKTYKIKIKNQHYITGITIEDLFLFLENHQDEFDARYIEENAFGIDPDWLKIKRKKDFLNPPPTRRKWTTEEDTILRWLLSKGKKYAEIGKKLNRSVQSVSSRVQALGLSFSNIWTEEELAILKNNYNSDVCASPEKMAEYLGKSVSSVRMRSRQLKSDSSNVQ